MSATFTQRSSTDHPRIGYTEFRTDLPSLQWVITGYSLTFATLLIIGGRLGDMYGHRRMFMVGAAIFGVGSLLASVSHSVPTLVLGEAVIEGIGASLLIPATLSILSTTFVGAEAVLLADEGSEVIDVTTTVLRLRPGSRR